MPKTKTIHVKIPPDLVPFIESEQKLAGNCAAGAVVRRIIATARDAVPKHDPVRAASLVKELWKEAKKGGAK